MALKRSSSKKSSKSRMKTIRTPDGRTHKVVVGSNADKKYSLLLSSSKKTQSRDKSLPIGPETREQAISRINKEVGSLQGRLSNIYRAQDSGYGGDDEKGAETFMKHIDAAIEAALKSGKVINPDLSYDDLMKINPKEFLRQAEKAIAPEYKAKFDSIKQNLTRDLENIGYDLDLRKKEIEKESTETLQEGTEDLAGRGLAFSSRRGEFETDVSDYKRKETEAARILAKRKAQELGTSAESYVGTKTLKGYNLPNIDGSRSFEFSRTPLVGSLTSEKQYMKEALANEYETQERERRAYTRGNLSFA